MNKRMMRFVAEGVCAVTFASSMSYCVPVLAAEVQSEQKSGEWKPVSFSVGATANEGQAVKVSSIPKGNAYIPKLTEMEVELIDGLSSKTSREGDTIRFKTIENLIINDVVVIPAETEVLGVVDKSRKAGGLGRGGRLEFSITSVKTLNGIEVPLEYTEKNHGAGDAGGVAVFAAVSIIGGIFMKGKNVVYNKGQRFTARVTADTDLQTKLEDLAVAMSSAVPHGKKIILQ